MAQKIVDLDVVAPETFGVKIDGEIYQLPGDIPIPDYIEIERLTNGLTDENDPTSIRDLYERVLDLFRIHQPELEELPIGPMRLGALVVQLYAGGIEEDEEERPTKPRGTRSTSRKRQTRSRSSRS